MIDLASKRVLVTGGAGFLGSSIVECLRNRGVSEIFVPRSSEYDLTLAERSAALLDEHPTDIIIHAAGVVGGIGANAANPGKYFYDNLMMGAHLIENARLRKIEKIVIIGTICSYPKLTPVPFREETLWDGYPEETNAPYGIAKRALLVQAQSYRKQYGTNAIYLLPVNLYGPGDNFDPENSHVIPAMIRKFIEAKNAGEKSATLWGTGKPTREFLFVRDAAEGIVLAAERYDGSEPVNLGTGGEISIKILAETVAKAVEFEGKIEWDSSRPDGQRRRRLDTSQADSKFGFKAKTTFEKGLSETVQWYRENS